MNRRHIISFLSIGGKMQNNTLYEVLEKKMYWAERRLAMAQRDVWVFRAALEMAETKKMIPTKRKIEQLEMFTA